MDGIGIQPREAPGSGALSFEAYGGSAPENYERFFVPLVAAPLANDLLAATGPVAGARVLDLACGTGVVAKFAAQAVGPTGTVTGVDINPGMIAVARATTGAGTRIDWREAPTDRLPFEDRSFDMAICQFGLQFFPDKGAALREVARVLAPDGRVAISTPGPIPPVFDVLARALAEHIGDGAARFVQVVFSVHDAKEIRGLLVDAGFSEVDVRTRVTRLALPDSPATLWQYVLSTPLASTITEMSDHERSMFEQDVIQGWKPFVGSSGLELDLPVATATGRL